MIAIKSKDVGSLHVRPIPPGETYGMFTKKGHLSWLVEHGEF